MAKEERQQQPPQSTPQRQHTKVSKSLRKEKDVLEVIMENTGAQLAYLDPDFNFIKVNSAYAKGSGHSIDELIGRKHFDLFPNKENQAIFEMVRDTGKSVEFHDKSFEYIDQPWRGITYWDWTLVPVKDDSGRVQGLVLSLVDTTERKRAEEELRKSEEKYRQLIGSLHEGIWVIDKDAYTTFANPRMAEMLGYTVEEMLGKHLFSFMDERGVEIATRNLERRRRGIKEQHEFEFLRKDGTRIYTLLETSPLTDDNGYYVGAIAGVQDITKHRRADEELKEAVTILKN